MIWIFFTIGMFIGMAVGVVGMAVLSMASIQADEKPGDIAV